jgi:hypothetical protein
MLIGAYLYDNGHQDEGMAFVFYGAGPLAAHEWQLVTTTTSPAAVGEYALAYDSGRQVAVLYGGNATGQPYENRTWEFDGVGWAEASPATTPAAVYGMAILYSPELGGIFLFGGSDANDAPLAQTWLYDGADWTLLSPATAPPARTHHRLAYDSENGRIYLFGGHDGELHLNDTWVYEGNDWSQVATAGAPPARALHSLAYHAGENRLYLFGGRDAEGNLLADLWRFDPAANSWSVVAASGPAARVAHSLIYDQAANALVLISGVTENGNTFLTDSWYYRPPTGWQEADTALSPPPGIAYPAATYDDDEQNILYLVNGQSWRYD